MSLGWHISWASLLSYRGFSPHTPPAPCFPKALRSVTRGARTAGSPAPHCRADLPGREARDWPPTERAQIGRCLCPSGSGPSPPLPQSPPSVTPAFQHAGGHSCMTASRETCSMTGAGSQTGLLSSGLCAAHTSC